VAGNVAVACGAALVSLTLYFLFGNAASVLKRLGEVGTLVMIRLMAFILLCIGIQIMWDGWAELNGMAQ
jgi:multiple antibiotic resistance protein